MESRYYYKEVPYEEGMVEYDVIDRETGETVCMEFTAHSARASVKLLNEAWRERMKEA